MPYRDITVTPTRGTNNEIQWEIELSHKGGKGGPGSYPPLKLEKGLEDVEIGVKIQHANQVGVKFSDDPIWVERLSSCPTDPSQVPSPQAPGVYQDQIKDVTKYNDHQITFVDLNKGDPMCLNYRLNFVDTKLNKDVFLDPIIDNGGGGGYVPPAPGGGLLDPGSSAFWMLLGSIFLACLAANLVARMIKLGRG